MKQQSATRPSRAFRSAIWAIGVISVLLATIAISRLAGIVVLHRFILLSCGFGIIVASVVLYIALGRIISGEINVRSPLDGSELNQLSLLRAAVRVGDPIWSIILVITLTVAAQVNSDVVELTWGRMALGIVPIIPAIIFFRSMLVDRSGGDELVRRVRLEGMRFAFVGTLFTLMATVILENTKVIHKFTWDASSFLLLVFAYLLAGIIFSCRRYN